MHEAAIAVVVAVVLYLLLYDFVRRVIAAYFHHKLLFTRNLMGFGNGNQEPPHEQ